MKKIISLYKNAFGGLSPSAWMLALVIFINRSGTMVIPFLSVYLTGSLGFSLVQTGWVMGSFGLGAIVGSYIGGWLTDKIGPFIVQLGSLLGTSIMFLLLSQVTTFYPLLLFIFLVSTISEMLRPANQISVYSYAKPENVTRAISLNRMAINLGFSVGPALGGFLAASSYNWLFIADSVTCLVAGVVFFFYFRNRKSNQIPEESSNHIDAPFEQKVWSDGVFLAFVGLVLVFASMFFQLFSTWPIYHREVFLLSEKEIGFLLGLNGLIVFSFEMILVYTLGERVKIHQLMGFGSLLMAMAFLSLYMSDQKVSLYLACVFISFAEIFAMPFMATYTIQRSGKNNKGSYMGLYAMGFAGAFMIAPMVGTNFISLFGFQNWWLVGFLLSIVVGLSFVLLIRPRKQLAAP